jgi:hypothetical protein
LIVEHGGVTVALVGHHGGDRRPVDAVERLEQVARNGHQRARVARRDAGLRRGHAAVVGLDLRNGDPHRRVLLAPQGHLDRVVHRDDLGRGHDPTARPSGSRGQRVGAADEDQLGLRMLVEKRAAGRQRDRRAMVAAHAIDGEPHGSGRGRHRGANGKTQASALVFSTLRPR